MKKLWGGVVIQLSKISVALKSKSFSAKFGMPGRAKILRHLIRCKWTATVSMNCQENFLQYFAAVGETVV
jgi:hypothetical protein